MARVWRNYTTDMGRAYPMLSLSVRQLNDVDSTIEPIGLLPTSIVSQMIEVEYPCGVKELTPRYLIIWDSEGAQWQLSYPQPFSEALRDFLTVHSDVAAFEFVGERIKYGRLRRMLDNV